MKEQPTPPLVAPLEALPHSLWPIVRAQRRHYGQVLNPTRWWGRLPFLFWLVALFVGFLDRKRSALSPTLRALVMTRVSQRCDCAFCIDANSLRLAERSGSMEKVLAVHAWTEAGTLFDAQERAALAYADAVTETPPVVSPPLRAALQEQFSAAGITELTALIAFQNLSARFNAALDIPAQGLCMPATKADKRSDAPHV